MSNPLEIGSNNYLQQEPMHLLDKQAIMKASQCFEDQTLNPQKSKMIMVQILYLINQGERFEDVELEKIYFRTTRLFQCKDPELKRMIYKILKIIMVKKFAYIIVQSILKDLISDNVYIRQNALKIIPLIAEESIIMYIEKYLKLAIEDNTLIISNTALLVGFNMIKKFPSLVLRWNSEIIEKLEQQYKESNLFAFNLLCKRKQNDIPSFIKILLKLIKQQLTPILNIQIIRVIKEVTLESKLYADDLIQYLFTQIYYKEPIVFLESMKQIILLLKFTEQKLQPLVRYFFNYIENLVDNIQLFVALEIVHKLIGIEEQKDIILNQNLGWLETFITNQHISISALAIDICIKLQRSQNIADYLINLLTQIDLKEQQIINFLNGLHELNCTFYEEAMEILKFLSLFITKDSHTEYFHLAILITERILTNSSFCKTQAIETLINFAQNRDVFYKRIVISIICRVQLQYSYTKKQERNIIDDFEIIKQKIFQIYLPFKWQMQQGEIPQINFQMDEKAKELQYIQEKLKNYGIQKQ